VSYADFLGIERLDHRSGKLGQSNSGSLCCVVAYVASSVEGTVTALLPHP
jgi:hypothetical protein